MIIFEKFNREKIIDNIIKLDGLCYDNIQLCKKCPYKIKELETDFCSLDGGLDYYEHRIKHRYNKALQIKAQKFYQILQ